MSENLEQEIFKIAKSSVNKAIQEALCGYNSPLQKLATDVVAKHAATLSNLIDEEFTSAINADVFRAEVRAALTSKTAKSLISKFGGELEKQVNELKSNPTTRAKITIAINNIIDELS